MDSHSRLGASCDEGTLVRRYKALAEPYDHRPIVARRGTLPSLIKFLRSEVRDVRLTAAATIALLADHPENPELLCRQEGLIQTLFDLYKASQLRDPELRDVIAETFVSLRPALGPEPGTGTAVTSTTDPTDVPPVPSSDSVADGHSVRTVKNRSTRIKESGKQTYRSIIIRVQKLSRKADVDELSDLLQTTRGVVSYTLGEMAPPNGFTDISILASTLPATLLKLLQDQGFTCELLSDTPVQQPMAEGQRVAQYPGNDRREVSDFQKSLVPRGGGQSSLSEKLRKQREEREGKNTTERSSIVSFMSKLTQGWW